MKKYLSYFKLRYNVALQYRTSAIAGMFTQLFFGIINILIYIAFYKNATDVNISLEQIISYTWLRQAFYSLINSSTDGEIKKSIENGNVSYEFIKPINIYWIWFFKTISSRLAICSLKCIPFLLILPFLPDSVNLDLPVSIGALVLFVITLFFGMLIMSAIINIFYICIFYTMTSKGITYIFYAIIQFFGGGLIPIALMPSIWQKICYLLPISLISDLPFRIYTGNINLLDGLKYFGIQIIWVAVVIEFGLLLMKKVSKKIVIQGG